ncbi:MAG: transcriptional regulator [Nanoarchaeota archaeon]
MTRRQEMMEMLLQHEISAQEFCYMYKTEMWKVLEELDHIKRIVPHHKKRLVMNPPICKACGFIFKEHSKVKNPSKCPNCHHERIQAPAFKIIDIHINKKGKNNP